MCETRMKITLFVFCISYCIGILRHVSAEDIGSDSGARAIQIITPVNHSFQLQLNHLKPLLEAEEIKDRHVVVVSIAGAFRKGKSFLLNFFIRYLHAQVTKSIHFSNFVRAYHILN